ncbi:MAG: hypothetical protein FJX64_05925 [Alphaproteobacteria bacterium]|nr:hypothetical protein [Alphaproteobacteria bacterium]
MTKRVLGWVLAAGVLGGAGPAGAEFWPTPVFLQQPQDHQRAYVSGLLDMYQHTRNKIAPVPRDPIWECARLMTGESIRARFVEWVLAEPALWRLSPAELFLQALEDFCRR